MPIKMYEEKAFQPLSGIKNIIAIAAGKGGVGKSTVSVNLALALKRSGHRVGILDTDIYGPSVRKMLPEDRMPAQRGEVIIPAICQGIRMMSIAYFRKENEAAAVRAPIANGVVTQFISNVDWGELDYLLIDFPPGTGDIQLTISQKAHLTGAVMVTTPQEVAVMDVRKAMNMFDQVNIPIVGIIENMSYFLQKEKIYLFGKGGGKKLAREVGVPFLGEIPIDPVISQCGDQGKSIFEQETSASQAFSRLAAKVKTHIGGDGKLMIRRIEQKESHTFTIEWSDGMISVYRASELQKQCPCAGCTGAENTVREDVKAKSINKVGRYALRIEFSTGCSAGIYDFDLLRKL